MITCRKFDIGGLAISMLVTDVGDGMLETKYVGETKFERLSPFRSFFSILVNI